MALVMVFMADTDIEPLLDRHLTAIRPAHSPQTVDARRKWILRVAKDTRRPVADATLADLIGWQDSTLHLAKATRAAALSHLRQYLAWVVKQGHRIDNPAMDLERPRRPHERLPKPISEADLSMALRSAPFPLHAWIGLGAFCGLRCMEIAPVEREHIIDGNEPRLRVIGKGDKERIMRLPTILYLELTSREFAPRGPLWPGVTAKAASRRINTYLHGLGIDRTAHSLRHRFGTKLYEATRDVMQVKNAMGHESIQTTMGYVKVVGDPRTDRAIEAISRIAA